MKQKPDFPVLGVETKVHILTVPLCLLGPEGLPRHFCGLRHFSKTHSRGLLSRILCFFRKKVGQKSHFCPRAPMSTGATPRVPEPGSPGPKFRNRWPSTSMGVSKGGWRDGPRAQGPKRPATQPEGPRGLGPRTRTCRRGNHTGSVW